MRAYLITAKPNRRQQALRAARHLTARTLITAGLLTLALIVFLLRVLRLTINLLATVAAETEYAASERAGTPPLGATLGATVAAAFTDEFARVYEAA
jgi:hypothetical protein